MNASLLKEYPRPETEGETSLCLQFEGLQGESQVQNLTHILSTDSSGISRFKTTDTTDTNLTTNVYRRDWEADQLYEALPDLVNNKFRSWYCQHFYRLGKDKVLRLAALARTEGKYPPKYFAKLLKNTQ